MKGYIKLKLGSNEGEGVPLDDQEDPDAAAGEMTINKVRAGQTGAGEPRGRCSGWGKEGLFLSSYLLSRPVFGGNNTLASMGGMHPIGLLGKGFRRAGPSCRLCRNRTYGPSALKYYVHRSRPFSNRNPVTRRPSKPARRNMCRGSEGAGDHPTQRARQAGKAEGPAAEGTERGGKEEAHLRRD